jgi:hypothetical protein
VMTTIFPFMRELRVKTAVPYPFGNDLQLHRV